MPVYSNTPRTFKFVDEDTQVGDKVGFDLVIGFYTGSEGEDGRLESFMRTIEFKPLGDTVCAYLKSWKFVEFQGGQMTYELVWGPSELGMAFNTRADDRLEDRPQYRPVDYVG